MNRIFSGFLIAVAFIYGLQLTACSKSDSGNGGGTSSFTIPNVTGSVSTTSAQSLGLQTVSNVTQNSSNVLVGGTTPTGYAQYPYISGMMHFTLSKLPDMVGCLVEALVNNGLVTKDGREFMFVDSDSGDKTKISVNASGNTMSDFKIYQCTSAGSQEQFMSGALTGEDLVFTFKNVDGSNKTTLSVAGKYNGTNWSSKTVSIYSLQSGSYAAYKTTQYADALLSQYSTSGYKIYSKFALSGTTTADYAMGAGSIMSDGSSTVYHWDANLANTTTASAFATEVAAGTYLTTPTSFTAYDITGTEVWDCQTGSATVLDGNSVTSSQYQAVSQSIQACAAGL